MAKYSVRGGNRTEGVINISGAKNSVLPILSATVLNGGVSVIHNCPLISDVLTSIDILIDLGADVKIEKNTVIVDSKNIGKTVIDKSLMEKMRSSVIFMGSLLARFGEAVISAPGGCKLGKRPIDLHLAAMRDINADVYIKEDTIKCTAVNILGNTVELAVASVGATENIMLASVFCKGTTTIKNAAREPEIIDLQEFINSMGGRIRGAGTSMINIEGVSKLYDTQFYVMPDRIETGTFLCMAAATRGNILLKNTKSEYVKYLIDILRKMNTDIKTEKNKIIINAEVRPKGGINISTGFYPGFPTDLQPQLTALLAVSEGTSVITEKIFEARDKHIGELIKMNADIENEAGYRFTVKGKSCLKGEKVFANDLRGGAALICAAMSAEGESEIDGAEYILRGYERFDEKLRSIGTDIRFEN